MILKPTPISTRAMSMHSGMLVCEHSDLRNAPMGRVWDDACDIGYTVVSHRTGREAVYAVEHVQRDGEGELQYTDLRPASHADHALPTLRVYND